MKADFKLYDLVSKIIPGFIIYEILNILYGTYLPEISILPQIALAYFIGFFIDAVSGWLEDLIYFRSWNGKPSDNLLNGDGMKYIKFHEDIKATKELNKITGNENSTNDELFEVAERIALSESESRIHDLAASYSFARSILTTFLIIVIILLISVVRICSTYNNAVFYISLSVCLILAFGTWYRAKERAYYYVKEVLMNFLTIMEKVKEVETGKD